MDDRASSNADPTREATRPGAEHRMPGWVKAFVIAGIVVVVVLLAAVLLDPGSHGPQRHLPGSGDGQIDAPAGHRQPADVGRR